MGNNCHRCGAARTEQARFCAACGAAVGQVADTPAVRKHVVVFFVDIVGSTALGERLDPESLRRYLKRYFDTVSAVLWRHGGTVEKFIGDAVMAVFGVPLAREDDAVRALWAARELHEEVASISAALHREYGQSLAVRVGVNGGEVFVSRHADGQYSVTGDVVNTAARLEQHAGPSETFVGGTVAHLAGPVVPLVPATPLHAKGKSQPLPAWRLDLTAVPNRRTDHWARSRAAQAAVPTLVGRDDELADLRRIADRVAHRRESCLVTVLGSAGIGKSRLVNEFVGQLDGVRVFEGHCPSYASGATFWPLAQVLEQLGEDWRAQVEMLLGDGPDTPLVAERLATAIGQSSGETSLDDIVWAARRLIEALGQDRPLVLVWEDLQWAEPTFVEFLSRLSARLRTIPVLMVCLSRPELLELHPRWGGGRGSAVAMELGPLPADRVQDLVGDLVSGVVAHGGPALVEESPSPGQPDLDRLVRVSEGNPLIVLQMMEFASSGAAMPVTVQTLFEARLDRLDPADRLFCECAAVMGREFWADAVRLVSGQAGVPDQDWGETLDRLVRLDVLQPTRARNAGRPGHRFTHALLMETVYRATPKSQRSQWHGRVAEWLTAAPELGDGERSELVAFHLERAHALLVEVSREDPDAPGLAARAADATAAAGEYCLARSDLPVAVRMFSMTQRLLPVGDRRHHDVVRRLFDSLVVAGSFQEAAEALDRADIALADDPVWTVLAPVPRANLALRRDPTGRIAARQVADRAIATLDATQPGALLWAYELLALSYTVDLQMSAAEQAMRTALGHARAAGDRRAERRLRCGLCEMAFWGATPVAETRQMCWSLLPLIEGDLQVTAPVLAILAGLAAMEGDAEAAVALMDRVRRITVDLRLPGLAAGLRQFSGLVALWTDDPLRAVAEFSTGAEEMAQQDSGAAATLRVMAARAAMDAGEPARAAELMGWQDGVEDPPADSEDAHYRGLWWGLAARFTATANDSHAEEWASRAVAAAASAENPRGYGDALLDLAIVYRRAGDATRADEALAACVRQYQRKGATHCAKLALEGAAQ